MSWLDEIRWDTNGLVPVIAQDWQTGRVLMFAWANREALAATAEKVPLITGRAHATNCGTKEKSRATRRKCTRSAWTAMKTW